LERVVLIWKTELLAKKLDISSLPVESVKIKFLIIRNWFIRVFNGLPGKAVNLRRENKKLF